jgi:hypothetical protein
MNDTLFTFQKLLCHQHDNTTTIPNPSTPTTSDQSEFTSMEEEDKYSLHTDDTPESPSSIGAVLPVNLFNE